MPKFVRAVIKPMLQIRIARQSEVMATNCENCLMPLSNRPHVGQKTRTQRAINLPFSNDCAK